MGGGKCIYWSSFWWSNHMLRPEKRTHYGKSYKTYSIMILIYYTTFACFGTQWHNASFTIFCESVTYSEQRKRGHVTFHLQSVFCYCFPSFHSKLLNAFHRGRCSMDSFQCEYTYALYRSIQDHFKSNCIM